MYFLSFINLDILCWLFSEKHGDDPCIVNGKDAYKTAKELGKYQTIPQTEGVLITDIIGRILLISKDYHYSNKDSSPQILFIEVTY